MTVTYRPWMAILFIGYLGFVVPLLPIASDDIRLVNVFSIDEADIATEIWNIYQVGWSRKPSFKYGGAFYYPPVALLHVWSWFAPVSEQVLVLILRFLGALAGGGCLWGIYKIGELAFQRSIGVLGVFFCLPMPNFLRWAVEAHPDLPQLFWLVWSLYYMLKYAQSFAFKSIILSAVCAGLAFATKFGGVFLLPVLGLALFVSPDITKIESYVKDKRRWMGVGVLVCVFVTAFGFTNPFAILNLSEFVQSLMDEKAIMAFGHRVQVTSGAGVWWQYLMQSVGGGHVVVLTVVAVCWGYAGAKGFKPAHGLLLLWVVIFFGYLLLEANLKRPRHLLPILPVVVVFVAWAYCWTEDMLKKRFRPQSWVTVTLVVVILFLSGAQVRGAYDLFVEKRNRESGRQEIIVGRWLTENFPPETSMVFDAYAYVPSTFQNVYRTFGMTYQMVTHFEPDLLIVRDAIAADFSKLEDASVARMGAETFRDSHFFYAFLQRGRFPDYRLLRDFETLAIYERVPPRVRVREPFHKFWRLLVLREIEGQQYGQVEALWTLAHLHRQDGNGQWAKQSLARAQSMKNYVQRIYSLGVRFLDRGNLDTARSAFEDALVGAQSQSLVFRVGIREDLILRYLDAGAYYDVIGLADATLKLDQNRAVAAFARAVALLGEGQEMLGKQAFDNAVKNFGPDPKGKVFLDKLLLGNIAKASALELLNRHFGKTDG